MGKLNLIFSNWKNHFFIEIGWKWKKLKKSILEMDCSWALATAFNFFLTQPPFFRTFLIYSLIFLDFFCRVRSVLLFHSFFKFPPSLGHLPHLAPWLSLGIIDSSLMPLPQAPCCLHGPPLGPCLAGEQLLPFGYNNKPQSTPHNNNIIFTIPTSNHRSNNNNNINIINILFAGTPGLPLDLA